MASFLATRIAIMAALIILMRQLSPASCADLGVNYGTKGGHLLHPRDVIDFLTGTMDYSIPLLRLYEPSIEILQALDGTNLVVSMIIPDEQIRRIATDVDYANAWIDTYILSFPRIRYRYLVVGSDSIPGPNSKFILQAMSLLDILLRQKGLLDHIVVTTAVSARVLGTSYPPSAGQFSPQCSDILGPIVRYLYNKAPLMIHIYPYYALTADPEDISLDYALFRAQQPIVDGSYSYYSLFEAMVDGFIYAMEKELGKEDAEIVVGETGWPIAGYSAFANILNAQIYNNNLKDHVQSDKGTPRRPDLNVETYIFELFYEDSLEATLGSQNFGTFYANFTPTYKLWP